MQYTVYCAKSYGNFAGANICSLSAWQTSLPFSKRQMRTHATYVAGGDESTDHKKEKQPNPKSD